MFEIECVQLSYIFVCFVYHSAFVFIPISAFLQLKVAAVCTTSRVVLRRLSDKLTRSDRSLHVCQSARQSVVTASLPAAACAYKSSAKSPRPPPVIAGAIIVCEVQLNSGQAAASCMHACMEGCISRHPPPHDGYERGVCACDTSSFCNPDSQPIAADLPRADPFDSRALGPVASLLADIRHVTSRAIPCRRRSSSAQIARRTGITGNYDRHRRRASCCVSGDPATGRRLSIILHIVRERSANCRYQRGMRVVRRRRRPR